MGFQTALHNVTPEKMTIPNQPRKLLVLDLDETLLYATTTLLDNRAADFRAGLYHVYLRPGVYPFLAACFADFTVAVWTSATPLYAQDIVSQLFGHDAEKLLFTWASDKCSRGFDGEAQEMYPRKNIQKVRRTFRIPLSQIIVVDDTPQKWEQSYGNLVRVSPFTGAASDEELPRLSAYLRTLRDVENVREIEKRNWRGANVGKIGKSAGR